VLATLPKFSAGLKLVRIGVFIMLLQLVLSIVMTVKALTIGSQEDAHDAIKWMQYLFLANIAAAVAMFIGTARAIPELRRAGVGAGKLIVSAIGFAVTAASLLWTYKLISNFMDVALAPSSLEEVLEAGKDLESLKYFALTKDIGYWVGLISLIDMVKRSAIANDQLALRDVASSMWRALLVMFVGDLFFQFTYGLGEGGGAGFTGVIASLLVLGYWIYCHVRLQRFLFNAAYFMNEPHNLPTAKVLSAPEHLGVKKPVRSTKPAPRPSQPSVPRPSRPVVELPPRPSQQVVVAPPPPPAPRPESSGDAEPKAGEPRFLR
jgi:hypothetical protein